MSGTGSQVKLQPVTLDAAEASSAPARTLTSTVLSLCAGVVTTSRVGETTVRPVPGAPPNVTEVIAWKFEPVIATFAPPLWEPFAGDSRSTTGAGVAV
jgi:hypothetical protein